MDNTVEKVENAVEKTHSFFGKYGRYILYGLVAIGLFVAGYLTAIHFDKNVVEVQVPVNVEKRVEIPVEVPVEVQGKTEVAYVAKENSSDSDVSIKADKPQVVMDYNGEQYKFDTLDNETQKFDKGKLDINTSSKTTLDVTPIVNREVSIAVSENNRLKDAEKELAVQKAKESSHKAIQKNTFEGILGGLAAGLLIGAL